MSKERCGLCHTGFRATDVICHSPIYKDETGVFHEACMKRVEAIIDLEGTNDISRIIYQDKLMQAPVALLEVFWVRMAYKDAPTATTEGSVLVKMHQHPVRGDLVHHRGYYYRVGKVIYDMESEIIDIECQLE